MSESAPEEELEFPGYSEWEESDICCYKGAIYIPLIKATFIGHWEVNSCFPIIVLFFSITAYMIGTLLVIPYYIQNGVYINLLFSSLFFLFTYSYLRTIIDGPGYFPFYWPERRNDIESISLLETDEVSPSGIISKQSQLTWARKQKRPPRCILSSTGRRIVIRPDHFCGWTSTWIGKRNHKFFVLFNLWGFAFILCFLILLVLGIKEEIDNDQGIIIALFLSYSFFALGFLLLTSTFAFSSIFAVFGNVTNWEDWNRINLKRYDHGCINNIEDVCGPKSHFWSWLLPISPWIHVSNNQLIENYIEYFD